MTTKFLDSNGLSYFWSKIKAYISNALPTKTSDLTNDSGYITGMTILSYGNSTWNDFITAYNAKKVVYCRASSNSNPASGSQTRLAFMAYVNNASTPTEVEFQYYRSVSSHSASQQGDQVFVYKITSAGTWSVTTREAATKILPSTGLQSSYSNGTLTITAPSDTSKQDTLVSGTNIKTINGNSVLGSGDLTVGGSVTSTSTPTADTIAEFDSSAHMNSADMSASDVQDFVDGLEYDGDGVLRSRIKATQDFDWDTDTPNHNPSSPQFTTQLEFINTNDNVVTHIDTHKYTYGATYSIFGTTREISGTDYYNQIGVGINDDGSFEYSIADKAAFLDALGVKDYITEQGTKGTTNIWEYRKWKSGKVEAWCNYSIGSISVTTSSTAYGGYRSGTINLTIPSGIFTSTPTAVVQKAQAQGAWLAYERATSSTNIEIMFGSGVSQSLTTQYVSVYAWQ